MLTDLDRERLKNIGDRLDRGQKMEMAHSYERDVVFLFNIVSALDESVKAQNEALEEVKGLFVDGGSLPENVLEWGEKYKLTPQKERNYDFSELIEAKKKYSEHVQDPRKPDVSGEIIIDPSIKNSDATVLVGGRPPEPDPVFTYKPEELVSANYYCAVVAAETPKVVFVPVDYYSNYRRLADFDVVLPEGCEDLKHVHYGIFEVVGDMKTLNKRFSDAGFQKNGDFTAKARKVVQNG